MIQFNQVGFSYGDPTHQTSGAQEKPLGAVKAINFAVEPGTCTLVCGPSGCGKTTVARLANGLAPTFFAGELGGAVLIDGRDAATLESWEVAAAVGSVFQNPRTQFFNVDSTGEVAFALESLAWPEERLRARVHEVIDEMGIRALADRSIFSLSGGEKQRIACASAWAPFPANLVLDEPTSNLDLAAIDDLRRYVVQAKKQGCAVLVAEHRLWWLADVVDQVLIMDGGHIVRRLSGDEFRHADEAVLAAAGLRVRDLAHVRPAVEQAAAGVDDPVLEVCDLQVSHDRRPVVHGASLSVRRGEVVALVGSNGAGKTTLCRTLAGLHKEDAGAVRGPGGVPLRAQQRLRATAMVFQDVNYQLFAPTVRDEVTFGLPPRADHERQVCELLRLLDLEDVAERHPATLSGGQKQRLAVASCLAAAKELLIFDEPTSGLDRSAMEAVGTLVRLVAARGTAVVVVTHDLEFIAAACDRVLCLERGRVAAELPASAIAAVRSFMDASATIGRNGA